MACYATDGEGNKRSLINGVLASGASGSVAQLNAPRSKRWLSKRSIEKRARQCSLQARRAASPLVVAGSILRLKVIGISNYHAKPLQRKAENEVVMGKCGGRRIA